MAKNKLVSCGCGSNECCPLAPPSVSVLLHWWQCFLDFNIKARVSCWWPSQQVSDHYIWNSCTTKTTSLMTLSPSEWGKFYFLATSDLLFIFLTSCFKAGAPTVVNGQQDQRHPQQLHMSYWGPILIRGPELKCWVVNHLSILALIGASSQKLTTNKP